ncbi:LLM class flavin-dependent oxidoreductase [Halobacillus sp. KGW1]|uniref:LLM class flavin-dependent oxidoreductase n=1 Tax=Halobacillus sp. KGW1 TaxID=1793726 RepID=UPI000785215D|nr:LLM class flavin-dependent oxidoreductase [Halobacillus sp. KGW1]
MRLSVLDQSPISKGQTAEEALQQTIQLAVHTEQLGYHRYWVAEHHNTNGLAGSSPEILIGQIAASTRRLRVGSGGVLLPQYSPLKVAETFRVLEAFHPERIDLGVGRSPGGGKRTRLALTDGMEKPLHSFSRQVKELQQFLHGDIPKGHEYYGVSARPATKTVPSMWVLGLSERGAKHAALYGTGFTMGHFISPDKGEEAVRTYRERFRPSKSLKMPQVNVCVFVVCADTQEEAERLAASQDLWLLEVEKGLETRIASVEEASARTYTEKEIEKIRSNRRRCIIGDPHHVKRELDLLAEKYGTEEFLVITNIYDFNKKKRSYELLAELM